MCAHVLRKMLERLPATCERGRRWLEVRISRRRKPCVGELDVRRWVQSPATCPNVTAMTPWSEEGGAASFKQGAACLSSMAGWRESVAWMLREGMLLLLLGLSGCAWMLGCRLRSRGAEESGEAL